ncbi:uncharacterized protein ASCRUDRAFT_22945, partial [Ascoidea rubescens DSM 1968]
KCCPICGKYLQRDLTRHLRIHQEIGRFKCIFPKESCSHKTGYFNRPYDFKKHLLHCHFQFFDYNATKLIKLSEKEEQIGVCLSCGLRCKAGYWLNKHVLCADCPEKCPIL